MENIRAGLVHRAFSVFLFNSRNELLLQRRSVHKITFPMRWTNTCCSHPLYVASELETKDNLGVKRAAVRKLQHELGIEGLRPESDVHYLTRIKYAAPSDDETWGEAEVDHILFIRKDVTVKVNDNEVKEVAYVNPSQLKKLFEQKNKQQITISPWFEMICNQFFFGWWERLDQVIAAGGLQDKTAKDKVHHLTLENNAQ